MFASSFELLTGYFKYKYKDIRYSYKFDVIEKSIESDQKLLIYPVL